VKQDQSDETPNNFIWQFLLGSFEFIQFFVCKPVFCFHNLFRDIKDRSIDVKIFNATLGSGGFMFVLVTDYCDRWYIFI
jgi:hypothetical protein